MITSKMVPAINWTGCCSVLTRRLWSDVCAVNAMCCAAIYGTVDLKEAALDFLSRLSQRAFELDCGWAAGLF